MSVHEQRNGCVTEGAEGPPSSRDPGVDDGPKPRRWRVAGALGGWARRTIESIDPGLTPRFVLGSVGGLLLGAIALVIVLRAESTMDPVAVRLAGPFDDGTSSRSAGDVRIAVGAAWALSDRFEHYDVLAGYLGERLSRPIVVVQRRTGGEIHDLLANGDVQAAVVCTGSYLQARARGVALEPLAVPLFAHAPMHRSLVVVRRSSELHSMADLRDHSFAFTDPTSLAGYYDPLAALLEQGEMPAAFFSRTVFTYGFDESLHAVRNGSVDAAAVDSLVFERAASRSARWERELRVVRRSPEHAIGPLVAAPRTSGDLRAALSDAWLRMHESPDGRAVLHALGIDRFVAPPEGLYDSAALVVDRVEGHERRAP